MERPLWGHEPAQRIWGLLGRHRLLLVLLVAGTALRVLAVLAYRPAILYIDSFSYLGNVDALAPDRLRPVGYSLILKVLLWLGDLRFVTVVQHLLGLGIAVVIYRLLVCHGTRHWLAALATAPVLLGGYQVQIEHNILSDVWFEALVLAVVWVLLRRAAPSNRRAGIAGLLLGTAVLIRLVGLPLVVPAVAYLTAVRWRKGGGWRRLAVPAVTLLAGFTLVLASYAGYYRLATGGWGFSGGASGAYGRAATVADCSQFAPASPERAVCPDAPREQRRGVDYYTHFYLDDAATARETALPEGVSQARTQADFVRNVVTHQPADLAAAVAVDFLKGFRPRHVDAPTDVPVTRWQFQRGYPYFWAPTKVRAVALNYGDVPIGVHTSLAGFLRGYQLSVGYTPGPLLALAMLIGLTAAAGLGPAGRSGIRSACLLASGLGLTVLAAAAIFQFSWRYQLPGLVLLPLAGALGVTAFARGRRKLTPPPAIDAVDQ